MRFILIAVLALSLVTGLIFKFFGGEKREWIMPKELNEISGITFIDDHTLACVQDEKGIIFFYDLEKSEITQRISFAGKGDYEGIAIVENTAYIVTGDGVLYEVNNFRNDPEVTLHSLELTAGEESEALCYDKASNRLLLAFKNHEKDQINPGLFAFDLKTKTFKDSVVIDADFRTSAIRKKDRLNVKKLWEPADVAIDKINQQLYIVDAINGHLLKLSMSGQVEQLRVIDRKLVRHPEGVAINTDGSIYICNDANNEGKGKIVKLGN